MLARTTNHQIPKNWKWERTLKHHYNFLFGTDYLFPPLPDLVILFYVKDCGYKGAGNKGLQPQHWRSPDTNTIHPALQQKGWLHGLIVREALLRGPFHSEV